MYFYSSCIMLCYIYDTHIKYHCFFFLMLPRPPISTLSDTLCPYTTLFLFLTSMAERSAWIMVSVVLFFVESLSAMITLQAADAAGANARACLYKRLQT